MQHNISDLMTSMLPGLVVRNEVEEEVQKLPLLSKLAEGHPIKSQSILLALPLEVLAEIMVLFADDKATLSALALVNSNFRKLARSYQFVDVCFDYGPRSTKLLKRLLGEAQARLDAERSSNVEYNSSFIGSYIRRVKVNPNPQHVAAVHNDVFKAKWGGPAYRLPPDQLKNLCVNAEYAYISNYRRPVLKVLVQAMPFLDSLLWYDKMCLDIEVFKALARLPLQSLKFSGVCIGVPLTISPPVVPQNIPLRSLYLDGIPCMEARHTERTRGGGGIVTKAARLSSFMSNLLERYCGSLERLVIKATGSTITPCQCHKSLVFPRLRYLDLTFSTNYPDKATWSSFLAAPLRHISLPLSGMDSSLQLLSDCPPLDYLETLVVPSMPMEAQLAKPVVDFILNNSKVQKLSVQDGTPFVLDKHILPALSSGKWSNLTSLSISWRVATNVGTKEATNADTKEEDPDITFESLAAINSLGALKQLCLGARKSLNQRPQWSPNHDDLRLRLKDLKNLQKLGFTRDTYKVPDSVSFINMENYYHDRWVTQREYDDAMSRPHLDPVESRLRQRIIHGAHATDFGNTVEDISIRVDGDEYGSGTGRTDNAYNLVTTETVWERAHRNRMLQEAEQYAGTFPKLTFMFCGQLPISIKEVKGLEGSIFEATPLSERGMDYTKILGRVFEMKDDE